MLLAMPAGADVLGSKKVSRIYETAGAWCQIPYSNRSDFGGPVVQPVSELLVFEATGTAATIVLEAKNLTNNGAWQANAIDNFVVARSDVFPIDTLWQDGGCFSSLPVYFNFPQLENDPRIHFADPFINAPRPEWTGLGAPGPHWVLASSNLPYFSLHPNQENGALRFADSNGPAIPSTSITLTDLIPGEEYGISFWWYTSIPEPGSRPEISILVLDTPRLTGSPRSDTITAPAGLQAWDYFYVDVPEGAENLQVDLYGLSADADLYMRYGDRPGPGLPMDCASLEGRTEKDQCWFSLPAPGRWWIGVTNFDSGSINYTIQATWKESGGFYTIRPCRLEDTRTESGFPLQSGNVHFLEVAGLCQVPVSAKAVSLNITAVSPSGSGDLRFWESGVPEPPTSTISFAAGQNRGNNAILGLPANGARTLLVRPFVTGNGTVHLIVDVNGYFQ
ncbi:MAG TPA: PPC domain-containing protein [Thermoanaerobaculia bacterium]|nr:PPC domain-containing protein [Thermoanaerobaculia bacterium]